MHSDLRDLFNFTVVDKTHLYTPTPVWDDLPILRARRGETVDFPFRNYVSGADTYYVNYVKNAGGELNSIGCNFGQSRLVEIGQR